MGYIAKTWSHVTWPFALTRHLLIFYFLSWQWPVSCMSTTLLYLLEKQLLGDFLVVQQLRDSQGEIFYPVCTAEFDLWTSALAEVRIHYIECIRRAVYLSGRHTWRAGSCHSGSMPLRPLSRAPGNFLACPERTSSVWLRSSILTSRRLARNSSTS